MCNVNKVKKIKCLKLIIFRFMNYIYLYTDVSVRTKCWFKLQIKVSQKWIYFIKIILLYSASTYHSIFLL